MSSSREWKVSFLVAKYSSRTNVSSQELLRTKNQKTQYTYLRTIFQLTQSTTWRINCQNPSCASSNQFLAKKHPPYVRVAPMCSRCLHSMFYEVSGDHTRTIQIATPTIGGLMKFAVKTVTCMGCKTPLRANNSVKGEQRQSGPLLWPFIDAPTGGAVCNNCRPRLGELYQNQVCLLNESLSHMINLATLETPTGFDNFRTSSSILSSVDSMPTLPRITSSGRTLLKQGLPYILYAEESSERCWRCWCCSRAVWWWIMVAPGLEPRHCLFIPYSGLLY